MDTEIDLNSEVYEPSTIDEDFENRLQTIFGQIDDEDQIRVTLHKQNKYGKFAICDNLDPQNIDYHEIGTKHGKGSYRIYVKWCKPTKANQKKVWETRNYNFLIDDYYDQVQADTRKKELLNSQYLPTAPSQPNSEIMTLIFNQMATHQQMMQQQMQQMQQQNTALMLAMVNKKDDGDPIKEALLKLVLDDRKEERQQNHEIYMKGLEMGLEQKRMDAAEGETNWKDIALAIIEQAPAILSPLMGGFIKKELTNPDSEYAPFLQDPAFLEFVQNGIEEKHPDKAEAILKAANLQKKEG